MPALYVTGYSVRRIRPVDAVIINRIVKPAVAPASRGNWGR
jgi:hypothetical protein